MALMVLATSFIFIFRDGISGLLVWMVLIWFAGICLFVYVLKFKCNKKERIQFLSFPFLELMMGTATITYAIMFNSIRNMFNAERAKNENI